MAELSLTYPQTSTGGSSGSANIGLDKRVLVRTGGLFSSNGVINLNSPGAGWFALGDSLTFSGATDFVENSQVYRNGQLLLAGETSSADNDVYFVSTAATIAFEFPIVTNDVLQIWRFTTTSG